jgi:hypothetical protein
MGALVKRTIALVVVAGLAGSLSSCAPAYGRFKMTDETYKPRGNQLAVLSGLDSEANVILAEYMAEAFRNKSTYKVLPAKEIKRLLPDYPTNIKGPYKNAYFSFDVDYGRTDTRKLKGIAQKLGVDYLYVLWAPGTYTSQGESIVTLLTVAELFGSPEARQIGNIEGQISVAGKSYFIYRSKPGAEQFSKTLLKVTENIAADIAKKTGMLKLEKN